MNSPRDAESLDEKYKNAHKLLLQVKDQLELLETGQDTSVFLQGKISTNLHNLSLINEQLEKLIAEQTATRRELWRM
jgi:hypothetical protein